jgi:hypothetical protein
MPAPTNNKNRNLTDSDIFKAQKNSQKSGLEGAF